MIVNNDLTHIECQLFEFFINCIDSQKQLMINQINNSTITKDCSEYSLLFKLDCNKNFSKRIVGFGFDSTLQILHSKTAPTVMKLFIKEGYICEFEVYNADLSVLDFDALFTGKVHKEF